MGRANLGALLGNVEDEPLPPNKEAPPQKPAPKAPAPKSEITAGYLRFVRKETRLREDQQNALTQHARRLNRAKRSGAPRITDNTLIRVAIDLLLDHIDDAAGDDEESILKALRRQREAPSLR